MCHGSVLDQVKDAHQLNVASLVECLKAFWAYGIVSPVPEPLPALLSAGNRYATIQEKVPLEGVTCRGTCLWSCASCVHQL